MRRVIRVLPFLAVLLGAACATPRLQVEDPSALLKGPLAFLSDGRTTRADVLLELGEPSARFEGDRILTYPLEKDKDGLWHLGTLLPPVPPGSFRTWPYRTGSLVLVFGPEGVLLRHSLVVPR